MKLRKLFLAMLGCAGLAGTGAAAADEMKFNVWLPPKTVEGPVYREFFDQLAKDTKGSLTGKVFFGGQLLNAPSTLKGIRDGVVQGGLVVSTFNLGELRNISIIADMVAWATDPQVAAAAGMDTILVGCEGCRKEQEANNIYYLGGQGPNPWNLMCAKPVSSLAEFKGKKVRVTGPSATRMVRALGGVAVNMTPAEIGPALSGGQVDCAVGPNTWLVDFALADSVKQVIDLDLGVAHGIGMLVVNRKWFDALPEQQRHAFLALVPKYSVMATRRYADQQVDVRQAATKRGVQFWKPGKDFEVALDKFRADDLPVLAAEYKSQGVANAEGIVKLHLANIEKWKKIVASAGKNDAAIVQAVDTEIYRKLKF